MKTKDIIQYESENVNTILLHVNKSVCRVYEVSAYWLSSHSPIDKFHRKHCRSHNTHLLYVWFHASKLDKILNDLHIYGFRPVAERGDHIILQNEAKSTDDYHHWKGKKMREIEFSFSANEDKASA